MAVVSAAVTQQYQDGETATMLMPVELKKTTIAVALCGWKEKTAAMSNDDGGASYTATATTAIFQYE